MKRKSIYLMIISFVTAATFFAACTKEMSDVRLDAKLTTTEKMNITSDSATVVGFIIAEGQGITEKGICYGTDSLPTIDGNKVVYTGASKTASFSVKIGGLDYATKYYARAYGITSTGTIYGDQITFTTLPVLPTVTTADVTNITSISADGGGNITNDGGAEITARGVCYSTNENPTIEDSKTSDGTGAGAFTSSITGINGVTTYYVRAYATNSVGTAYGPQVTFTTPQVKMWVVGDYNGWDNSDNAKMILSNATSSGTALGYVYLTQGGFKLVTDHSWDDAHTYGDDGSGTNALTNPGNNIAVPADGYYYITANLMKMTYSLTETNWGLIGDFNNWGGDYAMTYDPAKDVWTATLDMTTGGFKFRANGSWDLNYGDTGADGNLDAGGDNIVLSQAGNYTITLNLSTYPFTYTIVKN